MPSTAGALLVHEHYPPAIGGSGVLLDNVYRRLGCPVRVLTDSRSSPGPAIERDGTFVIERLALATPCWGVTELQGLRHHLRVARLIRCRARQLGMMVYCGRALPESVAALLGRLRGGPRFTCWIHGEDLTMAAQSKELSAVLWAVLRRAAGLIANSLHTRSLLLSLGIDQTKIHVVHPGVDPERFRPRAPREDLRRRFAPAGELLLLQVGRFQRRKGHDTTLRALALLRNEGSSARCVMVGEGTERPAIQRLAVELGLADRVSFIGEVSDADLPEYYAASDIFLMPNRVDSGDIEGFGIVFLEAQSMERPVIGGRSGGVPEAIADGVSGLLVGGERPDELAQAIHSLNQPARREELGRAGRRRVLADFTWERAASRALAVHQQLAAS